MQSTIYNSLIQKGIEKEQQRLRDRALRICRQRFAPDEAGLAAVDQRLRSIRDSDVLTDFLLSLSTAQTLDEALLVLAPTSANGHRSGI